MTTTEQWRPVVGHPDYLVSDQGRIASLKRRRPRILACPPGMQGYRKVTLVGLDRNVTRSVHVLVAEAFHGPRPKGQQVRHLDGDQLNNAAQNLAYGTAADNAADMRRHGTNHNAKKTHCPQGHSYKPGNTYVYGTGRHCRTCMIERVYARRAAAALAAANVPTERAA